MNEGLNKMMELRKKKYPSRYSIVSFDAKKFIFLSAYCCNYCPNEGSQNEIEFSNKFCRVPVDNVNANSTKKIYFSTRAQFSFFSEIAWNLCRRNVVRPIQFIVCRAIKTQNNNKYFPFPLSLHIVFCGMVNNRVSLISQYARDNAKHWINNQMLHPEAFLIHLAFMQIRDSDGNEQRRAMASPTPSTAPRRNELRLKKKKRTHIKPI